MSFLSVPTRFLAVGLLLWVLPFAAFAETVLLEHGPLQVTERDFEAAMSLMGEREQRATRGHGPNTQTTLDRLFVFRSFALRAREAGVHEPAPMAEALRQIAADDSLNEAQRRVRADSVLGRHHLEQLATQSVDEAGLRLWARETFDADPQRFRRPEQVRASHLLVRLAEDAGAEDLTAAQEQIDALRARIDAGEPFAELAAEYSEDPGSAVRGGDLGWFDHGRMVPEFEAAAFALEPGELSGPVRTGFGLHLIRLDDRRAEAEPDFDAAAADLIDLLRPRRVAAAYADLVEDLRAQPDVVIHWDAIEALIERGAREADG